jgi:hypothetical protein
MKNKIIDTFIFKPQNIKSLYWRTMAIIYRHFVVYFIFFNITITPFFVFFIIPLSIPFCNNEIINLYIIIILFIVINFLIIELLIDEFSNWFDILYSIMFILGSFIHLMAFFTFDKTFFVIFYIFCILCCAFFNGILTYFDWYKKLWGVNEYEYEYE